MTTWNRRFWPVVVELVLLLGTGHAFSQSQTGDPSRSRNIPFCRIVTQAAKFDHQILRTEAIYRRGGEIMSLYSPSCPTRENTSWVDYSENLRENTPPGLMERMDTILDAKGRAKIVAVVKFDGPKPVVIPPGTSPALADAMRGTNSKWGHQNQFNSRVVVLKIVSVDPVPSDAPWPK